MFEILRKIWKTGTVTQALPFDAAPPKVRGRLVVSPSECNGCGTCVSHCPADALIMGQVRAESVLEVNYGRCVFCGVCAGACPTGAITMKSAVPLATKNKGELLQSFEMLGK